MIATGRRAAPVDHWPVAKRSEGLVRNQPKTSLAFSIMQIFTSNNTDSLSARIEPQAKQNSSPWERKFETEIPILNFPPHTALGETTLWWWWWRLVLPNWPRWQHWLVGYCLVASLYRKIVHGPPHPLFLEANLTYTRFCLSAINGRLFRGTVFFCFCFETKSLCLYTQKDTHFVWAPRETNRFLTSSITVIPWRGGPDYRPPYWALLQCT